MRRDETAEWHRALEHAQPKSAVGVWFTDERPPGNESPGAQYFCPHQALERHGLAPDQLAEAESADCASQHRVIVHREFVTADGELDDETTLAALGALMRHELQHALSRRPSAPTSSTWTA